MSPPPAPPPGAAASGPQIARGVAWLMLFKLADRGVGLLSTLILARVLVPADFGLVAMATSVVALTQLMGAFGFDTALIQRQDCRREHYDTAWTFGVLFGLAIAAMLLVLSLPAATFYRDDRLAPILAVLALGSAVGGFENIGTVAFRKELDFRSEFRFLMLKRLAGFIVTVALALAFRTYWALVAGVVTSRIASVAISYRLHPYRPRLSLAARAELLHFSKWIFVSNLVEFLHNRSTDFVLGRTVGTHGLGIYNVAVEIAIMPSTELIAPLNRAVYPAYARLSGDLDRLRARFLQVFGMIALIGPPTAIGLYCVAEHAVWVVLGERWLEAIVLIRIFTLLGLFNAMRSNLYVVVIALGKPRANTYLSAGLLAVSLPAVVFASLQYGLVGAAVAQVLVGLAALVGIVTVVTRMTGVRLASMLGAAWRPLLAALLMAQLMQSLDAWLGAHFGATAHLPQLLLMLACGAVSYPVLLALLWVVAGRPAGAEEEGLGVLRRKLLRRRALP